MKQNFYLLDNVQFLNFCNVLSQSNFSKNNLILISAFSPGPVEVLGGKHKFLVSEKCLDAAYADRRK